MAQHIALMNDVLTHALNVGEFPRTFSRHEFVAISSKFKAFLKGCDRCQSFRSTPPARCWRTSEDTGYCADSFRWPQCWNCTNSAIPLFV
jgi:hypothetical protein